MSNFSALKTAIQNAIKQNGNEEITGNLLQGILLSIVETLGDSAINTLEIDLSNEATTRGDADTQLNNLITGVKNNVDNGYVYAGIATPSTTPVSGKVFYIALQAGAYTNFGNTAVKQGISILKYNGSSWSNEQVIYTDGGVFDVSAYNGGATYASLEVLLSDANLSTIIPSAVRKGGMSIKFVQTDDNKYVQYRLMSDTFNTTVANWQGVDDEPDPKSDNLFSSKGAANTYGSYIENQEYLEVVLDADSRIIEAINKDGTKSFKAGIELGGETANGIDDYPELHSPNLIRSSAAAEAYGYLVTCEEFINIVVDEKGRICYGVKKNGDLFFAKIPTQLEQKFAGVENRLSSIELKLNYIGGFIQQKKSLAPYFQNMESKNLFYRLEINTWRDAEGNKVVINPITQWSAPDPSIIKVGNYFYLFRTGKPCYIDRSTDLVNWESGWSQVFPDDFDYDSHYIADAWANDINLIDGKYVDYITIKPTRTEGSPNDYFNIVMYADSIDGPWSYGGVIVHSLSDGGPVKQAVDPEYVEDENNKGYLLIGSFHDIAMAPVSSDGLSIEEDAEWKTIVKGRVGEEGVDYHDHCGEGSYVVKHGNYYYLFVSLGRFADSTYRIAIARSVSIDPAHVNFVNKEGDSLVENGEWNADPTVILYSDNGDTLFGPGHNAEIYTDDNDDMYIILHCHVKGLFGNDSQRPSIIMRVVDGEDGWLAFADKDGHIVTKPTWECSIPQINIINQ